MGEKKRRLATPNPAIKAIELYVQSYQYALRALITGIPADVKESAPPEIATIGKAEIWPCSDGAVVLIYRDDKVTIEVRSPLKSSVNDFLQHGEAMAFFDANGNRCPIKTMIQIQDPSNSSFTFAANTITDSTTVFKTRYQKAHVIGWNAALPEPDKEAKNDFDFVYLARNLTGAQPYDRPEPEVKALVAGTAAELIAKFSEIIETAEREEDVQRFLADHPQMIYPEYIACYPKWKLGSEYVTDFVFLIQGANGPEYIFVELEKPSKRVFTGSGQFSAEFTQAKDQLNNWERWITQNLNYAQQNLQGLFQPTYHLIFGRAESLNEDLRQKLHIEFNGTSKVFSTYDDIRNRFKRIVQRLAGE